MGLASFKGKHNSNKVKVYLLLVQACNTTHWYRAAEIAELTGVPLRSLLSSLPIWTRWHRICRRKRGGYLEYRITNKGIKWFRQWSWLMPLPKYMKEIEIWQSRHNHKKENNEDNGTGK